MLKINKIIFALIIFLSIPFYVYAEKDSSGENGGSASITNSCSPNCVGIQRSSSLAGVRITFVDKNGNAVADSGGLSFDYETYKKKSTNFTYNAHKGDRNKIAMSGGGNFSAGSMHESELKKFSAIAAAFNKYAALEGSPHTTSLNTSGNTGGNLTSMRKELEFFLSLTAPTNEYYANDINAFIRAIAEVSGGFNADDLIYKVAEGCKSGDEIFIVMEPLFYWSGKVGGKYQNYFGSLADSYHFFGGKLIGSAYNLTNMAYLIYYERVIPSFLGTTGVSDHQIQIQSGSDLIKKEGFGIAVDWANDPAGYCGSCTYENGKFSFNNQQYPGDLVIPSKFPTVEDFAFTDRSEGGAGCCATMKPVLSSLPSEWQKKYNELCNKPEGECCTPEVPNIPPVIDVNNCCTDSTESKVIESELDDIFCRDNDLQVDFFKNRCNNEQFKTNLNEYCDLYCTERVTIEVPGAITAVSGRYFKLTETKKGTTSPYIEGYRRCRIKINYDDWRVKYVEKVAKQVEQFNEFQHQSQIKANYDDAIKNKETKNIGGTVTASCSEKDRFGHTTKSNSASVSWSATYYKYPFSNKYNYYTVKLSNNNYTKVEIVTDGSGREDHEPYSLYKYNEAIAAYEAAKSKASSDCGLGNVSVSGSFPSESVTYRNENPEEVIKTINNKVTNAKGSYEGATKEAYELEEKIDMCDYYFDDTKSRLPEKATYIGKDAKANYEFSPDLLFRYSQAYMNEESKKALDILNVEFDKTCNYETIYNDNETGVDEIREDRYSGVYGNGSEVMRDFNRNKQITYEPNGIPINNYYDSVYNAEKKYTTDAKYHSTCTWEEKSNPTYTLVPSGLSSPENTSVKNFTVHDREYRVYLSSFEGTYETYWDIDKIGHKGKLTKYFKNGKTCANENPNDVSTTITCKLRVDHELVYTGKCNGSNGTETTINVDDCDKYNEGFDLFVFKLADPSNLFPTGTTSEQGDYAKNWTEDERGQEVMAEIIKTAQEGKTYSPENISYSYTFTPDDLRHIKKYNQERVKYNGYSDFNLHCDSVEEVQTNSMVEGKGVTKCKSYLLEDLANGTIHYGNKEYNINIWNSEDKIDTVRQKLTNEGKW